MNEHWRDVIGYEGYYQVSDLGRVRSVDRVVPDKRYGSRTLTGRLLKASSTDKYGHLAVYLCKKGIQRTTHVHRLVTTAWIGPCPDGQEVRHGSNGVTDNSISNLCYGTRSDNNLDCRRDGTHGRPVRRSDGVEFISMVVAAEMSGCSCYHIWDVCNGRQNTTGGFGWEYI